MAGYSRNKRENFKEKCLRYLGGKVCSKCGVCSLPYACYDFHHINGLKENNISAMTNEKFNKVKEELNKCVILCSNCHEYVHTYKIKIKKENGNIIFIQ